MQILPIINLNYDNRTNFKSLQSNGTRFVQQTLPDAGKVAKLGAVAVLTYLGINATDNSKETESDDFQIRELTDREYVDKKIEIANRTKDFIAFRNMDTKEINEWNVQLFDYMLQNPDEYDDEIYINMVSNMTNHDSDCGHIDDKNRAAVALRMLKMPWFLRTYSHARDFGVGSIARRSSDENVKDRKIQMLDKLDKFQNTYTFSSQQENTIVDILRDVYTYPGMQVALKFLKKPELLDNQHPQDKFSESCFRLQTNKREYAEMKLEIINKINSEPKLFNKRNFFKHSITGIFNNAINNEKKDFVLEVLDNPKLFKSQSFADNLGNIISNLPLGNRKKDTDRREVMYNILGAIKEKPELFKNSKFLNDLGRLVFIQKNPYNDSILPANKQTEIGRKYLFLIKNGYYDNKKV